jgi:hypothetical protein
MEAILRAEADRWARQAVKRTDLSAEDRVVALRVLAAGPRRRVRKRAPALPRRQRRRARR